MDFFLLKTSTLIKIILTNYCHVNFKCRVQIQYAMDNRQYEFANCLLPIAYLKALQYH